MKIGTFTEASQGAYVGHIFGFGIGSLPVRFEPHVSKDGKDYFRIMADPERGAYEIGAAFPKAKGGVAYLSVSLESPVLADPIHGGLFADRDGGAHSLVWYRAERAVPKEDGVTTARRRRNEPAEVYN